MATYQELALDGASPVDLIVALYDGIIRFLYAAIAAAERQDVSARRAAVKRALAIIIHLQARLRMDIGGRPAAALSEFYASIFALILQASTANSAARFEEAIQNVRTLRDTWRQVAADPTVDLAQRPAHIPAIPAARAMSGNATDAPAATRWTA